MLNGVGSVKFVSQFSVGFRCGGRLLMCTMVEYLVVDVEIVVVTRLVNCVRYSPFVLI